MAKQRTTQEIQTEFNQKVFQLGNLQYQLDRIPRQIEDLTRILKSLDSEADAAHLVEQKAAANKKQAPANKENKEAAPVAP